MNFRDFGYTENDTLFDDNASLNPTVKRSVKKGRKPRFHVAVISVKYAIFFKGGCFNDRDQERRLYVSAAASLKSLDINQTIDRISARTVSTSFSNWVE